ncbi:MAG: zinc ribbon domain-containing protein [Acidimicrobiia bacterium]|nr:zinc ribbon domain-containing protein [Acidimicrobiia bacterium]
MTVGRCSACGHQGPSDARYCPMCGLPHLDDDVADSVDGGYRALHVEKGRNTIWPLFVVVTLAVGMLGWRYIEPGSDGLPSAGSEQGRLVGESTEPTAAPESTSASATTTITPPPAEVDLVELAVEEIPGRSGLAALAGHHLFVSHSRGLVRIDADTGELDHYDRSQVAGSLLGRYRDQLILVEDQLRLTAVSAEDPAGDSVLLIDLESADVPSSIHAARMIDDRRLSLTVWSFAQPPGRAPGRLLVDLEAGESIGVPADGWRPDDLTWVPGGGLFEFADGSYRYLADGPAVVAGRRHVLVHECQRYDDCARHWLDRQTGRRVDRPLPPGDPWQLDVLDPDDRLLFVNGEDGHRYFDVENGWLLPANIIRGTAGDHVDQPVEAVVGGRLLIAPVIGGLVIYDLDTHAAWNLDFGAEALRGVTAVVAVPKPNRWESES